MSRLLSLTRCKYMRPIQRTFLVTRLFSVPFVLAVNDCAREVQRSCGTLNPQCHQKLVLHLTKKHLSRFSSTVQSPIEPTAGIMPDLVDIIDPTVAPPPSSIDVIIPAEARQLSTPSRFMHRSNSFKSPSPIKSKFCTSSYDSTSNHSRASHLSEGETLTTQH